MPKPQYIPVNPALLRWARESAGFSVADASRRLGVSAGRLEEWEKGGRRPTVNQLRNAARSYRRPLAAFFLPAPPEDYRTPHDFRQLLDGGAQNLTPNLRLEIRRANRRRELALELMRESQRTTSADIPVASLDEDSVVVASRARTWLGISLDTQSTWRGEYDAISGWIQTLEGRNVLVFQAGGVDLEEMRGFSISATDLPVIVVNGQDHPRGRVFTLMHELSHLMMRVEGVCQPYRIMDDWSSSDERTEVFANAIAGNLLVPADALEKHPRVLRQHKESPRDWTEENLRSLARDFAVSREVILRRLLTVGRTTRQFYEAKRDEYLAEYRRLRERQRRVPRPVPRPRLVVRDNGRAFTRLVLEALDAERITDADLSDYLNVRLKHLDTLAELVAVGAPGG